MIRTPSSQTVGTAAILMFALFGVMVPAVAAIQLHAEAHVDSFEPHNASGTFFTSVAHGTAGSGGLGGGGAHVDSGYLGCSPPCGDVVILPVALTFVQADTAKMNLRVSSFATGGLARAMATAAVDDVLVYTGPPAPIAFIDFNVHVSVNLGAGNGDAVYGLSVYGPGNEDDEVHFSFRASDTLVSHDDGTVGSVRETRIAYVDWSSVDFVSVFIPTVVETTLDWIPAVYEQTFKVPILDATPAKTLPLSVAVSGEVIGAASVSSWHTAYIGASGDYISQNGYQYLGYALAVPEPADYTLMLAGLALLAVVVRSRHCNVSGGSAA